MLAVCMQWEQQCAPEGRRKQFLLPLLPLVAIRHNHESRLSCVKPAHLLRELSMPTAPDTYAQSYAEAPRRDTHGGFPAR